MVAIGGGSGLAVLLRGLKSHIGRPEQLTAIVTVADDGGSSGRLRRELGVLPPGDIRSCLVALADDEDLLARLFQYRFSRPGEDSHGEGSHGEGSHGEDSHGDGISGHSFGNLFLTALSAVTGDLCQAILTTESILSVRGRILPATLTDVRLLGVGRSGKTYHGESAIGQSGEPLERLELKPSDAKAVPKAIQALEQADLIVLGPGSLYTSILPNLLIPGIRDTVRRSSAPVVLILNLMTQPGETDHMSALDHLMALEKHAGLGLVDVVLVNSSPLPSSHLELYAEAGSDRVNIEHEALEQRGVDLVEKDLLASEDLIRHDPAKLGRAVLEIASRGTCQHEGAN